MRLLHDGLKLFLGQLRANIVKLLTLVDGGYRGVGSASHDVAKLQLGWFQIDWAVLLVAGVRTRIVAIEHVQLQVVGLHEFLAVYIQTYLLLLVR